MLSTRQVLEDRTYILSYIVNEVKGQEILKILINTSTEYVSFNTASVHLLYVHFCQVRGNASSDAVSHIPGNSQDQRGIKIYNSKCQIRGLNSLGPHIENAEGL